ncbi:DUF11 domain-containing protein [Acinetobacter johnsonii]|uniref:DUF11 domain-containing protein n=1 Tax=Acinetobacter johnsonii TaxID=40214 RepID=UPI002167E952|nr:DUF11 domain-containing protein [Acinetobacter johnsonii]
MSFSKVVLAVPTLEIMSASGSNSSSASLSDKTNTFVFNPANPTNNITQPYFPTTKVTYSITDNPYTGSIVDSYGLFYSANSFVALKDQGFPTNYSAYSNTFSSNRSNVGTGIDLATNYGVRFTTTWDKLEGKSIRTSGLGHYMGEITMRWDRPVTNPVINISGLGGRTSTINSYYYPAYGVSAQFKLLSTTNISQMYKLSGSNFSVSNWEIRNTSSTLGASIDDGGASGSVQLMTSSAITELKFAVYMRSDSSSSERINPSINSGADAFIFSASSIDSMVGDLVVSKTNGTNQVYSGGTTTYTVRVTNNGPDTYTGTELKDVVGTGLTATAIACSNAAGNKCSTAPALNSLASIDTGSLASGEFYEILVTARVDAAVGAKVKNTASVKPPTLGSSTGVACKAALTGTTTGLSRTFDEGTGTCTMSDEDTVQAAPDLQISKTANKDNYTVGEIVTYTIRAWNNSTINVDDAVVTDIIPAEIASLAWTCTKNGTTSTCPTAPAMMNAANSNTLNSTAFKLAANGSSTANYVEFVVTGLAYKEGNVRNTATVSSAILDSVEVNKTNNSAFANINIDTNSPNISGSSQNQCLNSQAVNLVTNTAFSRYDADNTLTAFENNLKTAGSSPTVLPNSIMYGTGPNGALQVKGRLSWSYGSPQSNTTGVTMRILVDGVVYAVLVTPGKSSNSTASFNALNGAQVAQADYALTSYQTDPGSINFTITLPTTVNNVKVVRTEFQSYASSGVAGDDIGIGFNEVNACLKPTFEMNKVSENGTDSFSFGSFSNLSNANAETITSGDVVTTLSGTSQSVRLKSNAGGQGSLLAYATPNTAIRFAESASTLYSLKSVECIDTNRAVSGNTSSNIGSLNGLTHTIPAENVKFASKFVCRVTNAKKAGYVFSGRVFNDNSGTTSDTSKAYNGVIDAGELGIAGSVIELQDCSSKAVLASATSNANGEFRIQTLQDVFAGRSNVCLVQRNVTGYDSVSSAKASNVTATADSTNDQFTIPKANNVTSYEGFLFGDAELQLILSQNGQKTIVAGDVVDYPHELMAKSVMNVLNLTESKEQQPANNQPWQSLVYVDSNCNAQLDQGEGLFTSRVLKANEKVCLIQRVISPTTAQGGDRFIASFKVNGKATYSSATAKESNSVNDITTIGTAGLSISKLVRKTTACPAPSSETTVFTVANQAAKGDYLEYQMTYTNNSNKNLVDVVLKDSVPVGTVYGAMSCTATGCQTQESSGQLKWTIPGVLAPKQKGQVGFCVRIPN